MSTYYLNTDVVRGDLKVQRITQEELANQIGVKFSTLKMKLRGLRSVTMDEIVDIARVLKQPPARYLGTCDPKQAVADMAMSLGMTIEDLAHRYELADSAA